MERARRVVTPGLMAFSATVYVVHLSPTFPSALLHLHHTQVSDQWDRASASMGGSTALIVKLVQGGTLLYMWSECLFGLIEEAGPVTAAVAVAVRPVAVYAFFGVRESTQVSWMYVQAEECPSTLHRYLLGGGGDNFGCFVRPCLEKACRLSRYYSEAIITFFAFQGEIDIFRHHSCGHVVCAHVTRFCAVFGA